MRAKRMVPQNSLGRTSWWLLAAASCLLGNSSVQACWLYCVKEGLDRVEQCALSRHGVSWCSYGVLVLCRLGGAGPEKCVHNEESQRWTLSVGQSLRFLKCDMPL